MTRSAGRLRSVPIAARFWIVLAALILAMGVMGYFGFGGMHRISDGASAVRHSAAETAANTEIRVLTAELRSALQTFVTADDPALVERTRGRVEAPLAQLRVDIAERLRAEGLHDADRVQLAAQQSTLDRLDALWREGRLDVTGRNKRPVAPESPAVTRIDRLVEPMVAASSKLAAHDEQTTTAAGEQATETYRDTRNLMIFVLGGTLLLGLGLMVWLIRSVVPRTRRYARFAAQVSAGNVGARLAPSGDDELAALGRSLDEMVAGHEAERDYEHSQAEFTDAMHVTESQDEANELIKRHLERSITDSSVVVLNRNNSDDRLEPRTHVDADSPLAEGLVGAPPRGCLAVRFGRRHNGGGDTEALLACQVCGKAPGLSTCDPLLVAGQVIGSVLVRHRQPLDPRAKARIRDSVSQAGPVLGNLRNLAIAELRAATDALTGLPNNRAARDTVKQMVAHATRSQTPLTVALLDLDHFKSINDTYGHGHGDEVLALVADVMRSTLRESDFVGRYGGEEFLILLPETGASGAATTIEKLRAAIANISMVQIDREITASIGVAVLPEDGSDADTLVRNADRALYAAKSNGRNRVETAGAVVADGGTV
jgi:diguanylate cyclase (GGDEF)-like protein